MGYKTDLTDAQWDKISSIFKSNKGNNFVKHSKRDLINAVLYLVKTGCQWRLLPNDFPHIPLFGLSIAVWLNLENGKLQWFFW